MCLLGEMISLVAIFSFVTSNAMFRKVETEVSPSMINAFRTSLGAITFIILGSFSNQLGTILLFSFELILVLMISIVFGQIIGDTAYFIAQKRLGTTISLAVSMTFPFFTFLISIIVLKISISVQFTISAVLIAIGILIMHKYQITDKNDRLSSQNLLTQDYKLKIFSVGIGLVAALAWALGIVFTEMGVNEVSRIVGSELNSSLIVNASRFPFAALCLLLLSYAEDSQVCDKLKRSGKNKLVWLFLASLLGTSVGALLYVEATRLAGAAFVSILWVASPIFALPITWFLNGEKISNKGFLGVIITIFGVLLLFL